MKYLGTVIDSGLFEKLNKSEYLSAFEELGVFGKKLKKDDVIFHEDDRVKQICIIDRGVVRGEKTYPDGELHIIQIYDENAIFGIDAAVSKKKTSPVDYICNEDSIVVFISLKNIRDSRYSKEIYEVLMQKLASDNIKKMHKIEILAEKGLRDRIMMYLDVLRKKYGSNEVSVKMSREQMAQYLCVNRSALSNELSKMKRDKLIKIDKDKFTIL